MVTDIPQPKDRKIMFKDIVQGGAVKVDKSVCLAERTIQSASYKDLYSDKAQKYLKSREEKSAMSLVYVDRDKSYALLESIKSVCNNKNQKSIENRINQRMHPVVYEDKIARIVNKVEMCRLQGFPDNWCDILTLNQTGSVLGDGWTLPIIEHIFSFIEK